MLHFYYGTMSSSKTLTLLADLYALRRRNKKCLLISPLVDDRFGVGVVKTRAGLQEKADILAPIKGRIDFTGHYADYIYVDEAQFLNVDCVDQLHELTLHDSHGEMEVYCYGIKINFKRELFPATKRLMELSDIIEEIPSICTYCDRKSNFNLKFKDGVPIRSGEDLNELGAEEMYIPVCSHCYKNIKSVK